MGSHANRLIIWTCVIKFHFFATNGKTVFIFTRKIPCISLLQHWSTSKLEPRNWVKQPKSKLRPCWNIQLESVLCVKIFHLIHLRFLLHWGKLKFCFLFFFFVFIYKDFVLNLKKNFSLFHDFRLILRILIFLLLLVILFSLIQVDQLRWFDNWWKQN